jgi:hypothetical protein
MGVQWIRECSGWCWASSSPISPLQPLRTECRLSGLSAGTPWRNGTAGREHHWARFKRRSAGPARPGGLPPVEIKRRRDRYLRPHADAFFAWAAQYDQVRHERGLLRSALGYAVRQKSALLRVFDDGRLVLDNNRSERALRGTIATGRKAWLFVGSDDHGQSAAHHFTLVASCRLHRLDPEANKPRPTAPAS